MKNKDFIKKSIEENIVDHATVLNNLKAKASAVAREQEAAKPHVHSGFRRVALVLSLLIVTSVGIYGAANLFDNDNVMIPPDICDSSVAGIEDMSSVVTSEPSASQAEESVGGEISFGGEESENEVSRQVTGESEIVDNTTELEEEDMMFFVQFSEEYANFQKLIYAKLEYDEQLLMNGYAPVVDQNFGGLKDVRDYLNSFLTVESASDLYYNLIGSDEPIYYEDNGILFIRTDYESTELSFIHAETAKQVSKTENILEIRANKTIGDSQNSYLYNFTFEKGRNGEWLYQYDPDESNPF